MRAAATMPVEVGLSDVRAVYAGAEGDLWELLMGQQIHVGGLRSTLALAERAAIGSGQCGVDLCCCNGAGMRALVRFRGVAAMTGVDATPAVVERGRLRCEQEGLDDRIRFVLADACASGLPGGEAGFVWGEDAWCYVADKGKLIAEAVRLLRPGGTIAFSDWVVGPAGLAGGEAERLLAFMKFPNLESIDGYRRLLESQGCRVSVAEDTGCFAEYIDLYRKMAELQLGYDVMRVLRFDQTRLAGVAAGMAQLGELAGAGKVTQARFIAHGPA